MDPRSVPQEHCLSLCMAQDLGEDPRSVPQDLDVDPRSVPQDLFDEEMLLFEDTSLGALSVRASSV